VIVTGVTLVTTAVVTVNVTLVALAATVTLAGVVADALLSDRITTAPPAGAGPFNVTVPVEETPPPTVPGFITTPDIASGLMPSTAVFTEALKVAVIVAEVEFVTAIVVAVNVTLVAPAGMVTPAGTLAPALLLDRATSAPPAGAGLFKVTVPVEELPPTTLPGFIVNEAKAAGGLTVRVPACAVW
jgi:hypothetical protein